MAPKRQRHSESASLVSSDDEFQDGVQQRKRQKRLRPEASRIPEPKFNVAPLFEVLGNLGVDEVFDEVLKDTLPELLDARRQHLEATIRLDSEGRRIRDFTSYEKHSILTGIFREDASPIERLIARKIKLGSHRRKLHIKGPQLLMNESNSLTVDTFTAPTPPNPEVIDGLYSIKTTPFESSLLGRICGPEHESQRTFLARDWEARSLWLDLMEDVRWHHFLSHSEDDFVEVDPAPIDYETMQPKHLLQIHELLRKIFWPGIDISDSLQYSPEKCTVVASYKSLVVGVVFLSSPQETYITYLVVRPGWENSRIATKMLYHLLSLNPTRDIILHVSANNPAMLLYNQFGFKAEEFIVGFYEDYLDSNSRGSKNAFRLRLRR